MHPTKAPRPDDYHAIFFKKQWHIVGSAITTTILKCLNLGEPISTLNETFITLIPKVKKVQTMADFRSISLCNVVYKILSKVLVGESQSAFVSNKLIIDDIIIATEIFISWIRVLDG